MTLLLAEGFEHIHPSAKSMSGFGSKAILSRGSSHSLGVESETLDGPSFSDDLSYITVPSGLGDGAIANARKGGKAVGMSLPYEDNYSRIMLRVKKSRTLFVGFAFRILSWQNLPQICVSFGRYNARKPLQDNSANTSGNVSALGGCLWSERGGYADLQWSFVGQDTVFDQIIHNRSIVNGDWCFVEFATTVYGGTTENPQGWGEARISKITKRRENIQTTVPGSEEASFIDTVNIRVLGASAIVFDDIYITDDQGDVNNGFLGSVYIRPMSPSHSGGLMESITVNTDFRHTAVGPAYVGDESELPSPLPTPEEDPHFTEWGDPTESHMLLPVEGAKQTFRCTDVPFLDSDPRIHGVVLDVIAEMSDKKLARSSLTPIKTIGGDVHTYYPISCDMVPHGGPVIHQLVMENPKASDPVIDMHDADWSAVAVNNSEYGFQINKVTEQLPYNPDWHPAMLRYPLYHEKTVDEGLGLEDWPMRYWEEFMSETLSIEPYSRWDWACPVYENLEMFDATVRIRASYCSAWSNTRMEDKILMPEKFMKDSFGFEEYTQVDAVTLVEETVGVADTSYHEWVEELQSWFDPYDFTKQNWGATVEDSINLAITDIFDNHFFIGDTLDATAQTRSNHEFIGETLYPDDSAKQGIGLFAEDGFDVEAYHFDGNWVEQVEDWIGHEPSILTRHWRFELLYFVCINWWNIGVVEQPLEFEEPDPCAIYNDDLSENYKEFFGIEGYYGEIKQTLKEQWLLAGGDPSLDFDDVRWASFNTLVYDEYGNVIDMLDDDGNSIIQEIA